MSFWVSKLGKKASSNLVFYFPLQSNIRMAKRKCEHNIKQLRELHGKLITKNLPQLD